MECQSAAELEPESMRHQSRGAAPPRRAPRLKPRYGSLAMSMPSYVRDTGGGGLVVTARPAPTLVSVPRTAGGRKYEVSGAS
eukprot:scaffold9806_cov68-Phaeocystis_antarctica.AAC.1